MIGKRLRKIIQELDLIYCILKQKWICPAYISKINLNCKKHLTLLIIPNELLLEFLSFFQNRKKVESHEKVCKNIYFCRIVMSSEEFNKLEFNECMK